MRPGIRWERLCGLLLVVAVWSHSAPAKAGLIGGTHDSIPLGNTAALTGGAGLAIFQDGDAAWYNVAGLGGVARSSLSVSGTGLLVRLRAVPDLLAIDAGQGYRTAASLESNEFMSVPSMIVSVWNLTEGLTLGVGFFAPEVEFLTTRLSLEVGFPNLEYGWVGLYDDLELTLKQVQYEGGVMLGWEIMDALRIGLGVSLVADTLSASMRMIYSESHRDAPPAERYSLGTLGSWNEVFRLGLCFTLGLQSELVEGFHLGFTFRGPTLQVHASQTGVTDAADLTDSTLILEQFDIVSESDSPVELVAPMRLQLGLAYELAGGWLALDGDLRLPLENNELGINSALTWNVRFGGRFPVAEDLWLGVGLFTDRSTTTEIEGMLAGRIHYYGLSVGAEFDTRVETSGAQDMIVSLTIAARYAAGVGEMGVETLDVQRLERRVERRSVLFHEIGIHIGSAILY